MDHLQRQYLSAAYEQAKDSRMRMFSDDEVVNQIDLDRTEPHFVERFEVITVDLMEMGFIESIAKGSGVSRRTLRVTGAGMEEAKRLADPIEQRKDLRKRFLRIVYELAENHPIGLVTMPEVAPHMGMDADDPNDYGRLTGLAKYFVERGYARRQFAGFEAITLTAEGVDEVEGNRSTVQAPSVTTYNIGLAQGSIIGNQQYADLSTSFDFSVYSEIKKRGGDDAEPLERMMDELHDLLERGGELPKGKLAQYGEVMARNQWIIKPVVDAVMRFATSR